MTFTPLSLRALFLTLLSGGLGAFLFYAAGLPSPWLSGAMVGIVVLMLLGQRPALPDPLRDLGMLLAGSFTGSSITQEMLSALAHYPLSLFFLAATTAMVVYGGAFVLRRFFGWDAKTAFFAAAPGALSAVVASVAAVGGDMTRVVAAQAFRLFILVALLPSAVLHFRHVTALPAHQVLEAPGFALVIALAFALGLVLLRFRVVAPWFLGGMLASASLHLSHTVVGTPPSVIGNIAMTLVGIFAASRMADTNLRALGTLWLSCLSLFLCSTVIALAGGYITHLLAGVPLAEALVAFAPGGLEAMVVLGLSMGMDPLYVTSHHVARFLLLAMVMPMLARHVPGERINGE